MQIIIADLFLTESFDFFRVVIAVVVVVAVTGDGVLWIVSQIHILGNSVLAYL